MSSAISRFITRLRLGPSRHKANITTVGLDPTRPPIYQRVPPWWTRWTVALVACDIFMASSAIEFTWNHWTKLIKDERPEPSDGEVLDPPRQPDYYGVRPTWQRAGLCFTHLTIGVGIAVALTLSQSRYVRLLSIIPHAPHASTATSKGSKSARIFLQAAHNRKNNGLVFQIEDCAIQTGRDHSEIILRVRGERGHWFLPVDEALIHGQKTDTWAARDEVLKEWVKARGRKTGQWPSATVSDVDKRWRSGPVIEK